MFESMALDMDARGFCVCSSFGKDSVALTRLFQMAKVKFFVQWNLTGIDPPELMRFARSEVERLKQDDVHTFIVKPRISMRDLIIKKGLPPTRLMRYCCSELKERKLPETKSCFFSFGIRKAESVQRSKRCALEVITSSKKNRVAIDVDLSGDEQLMLFNDNDEKRKQFENCTVKGVRAINPMIYWTDSELWGFLNTYEVPYCELYNDGFTRLGCIGCPMSGKKGKIEMETHYPKFKDYYIKTFDSMLKQRNENGKSTQWQTGEDVYKWWTEL